MHIHEAYAFHCVNSYILILWVRSFNFVDDAISRSLAFGCRHLCISVFWPTMMRSSIYVVSVHLFQREEALLQMSSHCLKTDIFVWRYIVYSCFVMSGLAVLTDWFTPSEQICLLFSFQSIATCIFSESVWVLCAFHLHLHSSSLNISRHCGIVGRSFMRRLREAEEEARVSGEL